MSKKIPPNAKKVFTGIISDIYQWEQELFDGTTTTFERIRFKDGAFVIATVGEKVIITHQEQPAHTPFIGLPGGGFDTYDEDPLECAKRELLEETGYVSDHWEPWMVSE
jgi:ADP-ribose pyrophosphatase